VELVDRCGQRSLVGWGAVLVEHGPHPDAHPGQGAGVHAGRGGDQGLLGVGGRSGWNMRGQPGQRCGDHVQVLRPEHPVCKASAMAGRGGGTDPPETSATSVTAWA
jgi:hypothetical protein